MPPSVVLPPVVLLVDAANVVGSRPDGWWRDRAGAAARLVGQLRPLAGTALPLAGPAAGQLVARIVVVLEGAARAGVPEAADGPFRVLHAPGSGDDLLAGLAAPDVLLVTADRELTRRAVGRGAQVAGPRWLLAQML